MLICCLLLLINPQLTKEEINLGLRSCGDVESNPGPRGVYKVFNATLKIIQQNINCWKQEEIAHMLDINKPDVCLLQETSLL